MREDWLTGVVYDLWEPMERELRGMGGKRGLWWRIWSFGDCVSARSLDGMGKRALYLLWYSP